MGKTRLVQELGVYARQRGGRFLEGHYLREGEVPYAPWTEVLRTGTRGLGREDLRAIAGVYGADLSQLMPELQEQAGPFPDVPRAAAEARRQRLYDGVLGVLAGLAARHPLVVLLDDYQWAPQLTLLQHVARHLDACRALVIAAYREQEFGEQPALVQQRDEMNRARLFTPLPLRPLAESQTGEMLAHALGEQAAGRLRSEVHARTQGNPFSVEEVLRSLAETGAVQPAADGGWEVAEAAGVRLPESLKLAVEGRVARLGEEADADQASLKSLPYQPAGLGAARRRRRHLIAAIMSLGVHRRLS